MQQNIRIKRKTPRYMATAVPAIIAITAPVLVARIPTVAAAPAAGATNSTSPSAAPSTATTDGLSPLAGTSAVAPLAVAPNINILLIPFDGVQGTSPGAARVAPAAAIVPRAPIANGALPARAVGHFALQIRALAKKKPNPDDDQLFDPTPLASGTLPRKQTGQGTDAGDAALGQVQPAMPAYGLSSPPDSSLGGASSSPGVAQNAVAPLRRALVRAGFADVLTTPPDGTTVRRVVNEHRLSSRVVRSLQDGLREVVSLSFAPEAAPVTAAPVATEAGKQAPAERVDERKKVTAQTVLAASRLGQALGYRCVVLFAVLPSAAENNAVAPVTDTPAGAVPPNNETLPATTAGAAPAGRGATGAVGTTGTGTTGTTVNGATAGPMQAATYAVMVVDAMRGTNELLSYDGSGSSLLDAHEGAAATGSALLLKKLSLWPDVSETDKSQMAADYLQQARAIAGTSRDEAMDLLGQSIALDGARPEAYVMQGDLLRDEDPAAAARAYRRALESNPADAGVTWEKMAISYATSKDWPRTIDAANHALTLRRDTAALQAAMATAQFGRAELFRKAGRDDSAEDAQADGRQHLERARTLAPDDPAIAQMLAKLLMEERRFPEAIATLDAIMEQVDPDLDLQTLYANALSERDGREVEAFLAWARVWKMSATVSAPQTSARYRRLAEGFDEYVSDTARQAAQQAAAFAADTVPRETTVLQLQKLGGLMSEAAEAVKIMQPPTRTSGVNLETAHTARLFAATLLVQAIESYRAYVETGDDTRRSRAFELHRQAINQLNAARGRRTS